MRAVATTEQAADAVARLMKVNVERVEPPRRRRGHPAESFRCWLTDDRSVIATCRTTATRTAFEAHILRALGESLVPVPEVYAAEGGWLIQQDLGSARLSRLLESEDAEALLSQALEGLTQIHEAGRAASLDHDAPKPERFEELFGYATKLASQTDTALPGLDREGLREGFDAQPADGFIKSDARPARALVDEGRVVWFDWAHCARGRRLQDLIWLLGDEALPEKPDMEATLLDRHLPRFIGSLERGRTFFAVYGTLHLIRRMQQILTLRDESGEWWSREECLDADHPIVTVQAFECLQTRAQRWAKTSILTSPFARWLKTLSTDANDSN